MTWFPPPPLSVLRRDVDPLLSGIDRAMGRDRRQRFNSAEQMRAALNGDRNALLTGGVHAWAAVSRPATKVLHGPLAPSATYFVPAPRRRLSRRARESLAAAAVLVALIISALAIALDSSSTTQAPKPISTSTSVPTPTSIAPPSPAISPGVQPERPEQKKDDEGGGNGDEGD